jgi:hypothetical protein
MAKLPGKLADELAGMLQSLPASRPVWVLGENDAKPDGQWPGRDGALQTSRLLMTRLQRPFQWALPGGQSKDLRSWFREHPEATADDFLAELCVDDVPALDESGAVAEATAERPRIELRLDEKTTVDDVLGVIHDDADLYSMRQELCRIVTTDDGKLKPLPHDENSLRNLVAGRCDFFVMASETDKASRETALVPKPARIQSWVYKGLSSRGEWPGVRPLVGVVNRPSLRPDGSVADVPGYDAATRLFLDLRGEWPRVPDAPSLETARAAAGRLLDVVCDFPFADDASRAGWLCAVLTPLARPAYMGATAPLFAIDANTRGSGKSLLAELVGQIVLGDAVPRIVTARDGDEMRKRLTAVLLANTGSGVMCFDNVVNALGGEALDALLTADVWTDRALGTSHQIDIPARVTWLCTGNNLAFSGDMERRVCRIRLESQEEHPEERTAFKYPDVIAHVRRHRRELLIDALTILRGFDLAGRPFQSLPAWGSFEGWSNLVRQAVAWVGVGDAGAGRALVREEADESLSGVVALMNALESADPGGDGLTARAMLEIAKDPGPFQDAVAALCDGDLKLVTPKKLGNRLRAFKGRNVGGRVLTLSVGNSRERYWFCAKVELMRAQVCDSVTLSDSCSEPPRSETEIRESECDLKVAGNRVTQSHRVTADVIDDVANSFQ